MPTDPTTDLNTRQQSVRLVLASASPARRATLVAAGLDPEVVVSGVDEDAVTSRHRPDTAADAVQLLARAKAEDVAGRLVVPDHPAITGSAGPDPVVLVLGCDSLLELDAEVHGKPADADEARSRWRRMRGRTGVLHTGHRLIRLTPDLAAVGAVCSTTVRFADVDDDEIEAYLATGEPLGVAGAFTVDGLGAAFVRGVDGDHHGVVGVSVPLLRDLVRRLGLFWPGLWRRRV